MYISRKKEGRGETVRGLLGESHVKKVGFEGLLKRRERVRLTILSFFRIQYVNTPNLAISWSKR